MGIGDKTKKAAEQAKNEAKGNADRMAGDSTDTTQPAEGRLEQGKANLRQGAEKAKNTFDR